MPHQVFCDTMIVGRFFFFFFNDTATTEIYPLSLHDALPIFPCCVALPPVTVFASHSACIPRSEEHTSELQSLRHLVCRLLLEKKKDGLQCRRRADRTGFLVAGADRASAG